MILEWMVYASATGALMGGAAACVERVSAAQRAPRRWPWLAAIVASVIVPVAVPMTKKADSAINGVAQSTTAIAAVAAPASSRLDLFILAAWGVASVVFALLLVAAHLRNKRMLAACQPGRIAGHDASISPDFGPALVGTIRPRIVVPSWALTLDHAEQRLIVMHELEHAAGRDPYVGLLAAAAVVIAPWNAGLWWQLLRLRLAIELDCDTRVVARQHDGAVAYSQLLLHVRERGQMTRHPSLALSHAKSSLGKRLDALLRRHQSRVGNVAAFAAMGVCLVAGVGFIPAPRAADVISALHTTRESSVAVTPAAAPAPIGVARVMSQLAAKAPAATKRSASSVRFRPSAASDRTNELSSAAMPPMVVASSNPLAQMTVGAAPLPRPAGGGGVVRRVGGTFMTAAPSGGVGGRGGGAGGAAGAVTSPPGSGGAAGTAPRAAVAGGFIQAAGRAPAVVRPDTTRPPAR